MVASAFVDFLASPRIVDRMPFRDDMEVGRDIQQAVQQQGPRLARQFFQREHTDVEIIQAQMAAMRFKFRIAHLPVQMLHPVQPALLNLEGAEIHETPDEPEGFLCP